MSLATLQEAPRHRNAGAGAEVDQEALANTALSGAAVLPASELSHHLRREYGMIVAPSTTKKWRLDGRGPPFFTARRRVYYEIKSVREWALAQRSPLVRSTSELEHSSAA